MTHPWICVGLKLVCMTWRIRRCNKTSVCLKRDSSMCDMSRSYVFVDTLYVFVDANSCVRSIENNRHVYYRFIDLYLCCFSLSRFSLFLFSFLGFPRKASNYSFLLFLPMALLCAVTPLITKSPESYCVSIDVKARQREREREKEAGCLRVCV